ncbi:hypothetical protein RI367_006511 [Sorochytrium milnesiophthora]
MTDKKALKHAAAVDQFGFYYGCNPWPLQSPHQYSSGNPKTLKALERKWMSGLLKRSKASAATSAAAPVHRNTGSLSRRDSYAAQDQKYFCYLARQGIPPYIRASVWQQLLGADELHQNGLFVTLLQKERLPVFDDIERTLLRTMPNHSKFHSATSDGIEPLRQVLQAFAHIQPTAVQASCEALGATANGLHRLAALFLMRMTAEQAFDMLQATTFCFPYFTPAPNAQLHLDAKTFERLLERKLPDVHRALARHQVDVVRTVSHWWCTGLTYVLPWSSVLRCWDVLCAERVKGLMKVTLAVFACLADAIAKQDDALSIGKLLNSPPFAQLRPERLMDMYMREKFGKDDLLALRNEVNASMGLMPDADPHPPSSVLDMLRRKLATNISASTASLRRTASLPRLRRDSLSSTPQRPSISHLMTAVPETAPDANKAATDPDNVSLIGSLYSDRGSVRSVQLPEHDTGSIASRMSKQSRFSVRRLASFFTRSSSSPALTSAGIDTKSPAAMYKDANALSHSADDVQQAANAYVPRAAPPSGAQGRPGSVRSTRSTRTIAESVKLILEEDQALFDRVLSDVCASPPLPTPQLEERRHTVHVATAAEDSAIIADLARMPLSPLSPTKRTFPRAQADPALTVVEEEEDTPSAPHHVAPALSEETFDLVIGL